MFPLMPAGHEQSPASKSNSYTFPFAVFLILPSLVISKECDSFSSNAYLMGNQSMNFNQVRYLSMTTESLNM